MEKLEDITPWIKANDVVSWIPKQDLEAWAILNQAGDSAAAGPPGIE